MDIVHITSEFAPIAKVGGLGDALYGLAHALRKKGEKVKIFVPKYDCIDLSQIEHLRQLEKHTVVEGSISHSNTLWQGEFEGLELILIETDHPNKYFNRGRIYGEEDDNERFLYFCAICREALKNTEQEVIHLHDWPSAVFSLFQDLKGKKVFTIHNLEHQGICSSESLENLGIPIDEKTLPDLQYPEAFNLVRTALTQSDAITTVSPSYAREILESDGGFGLEEDLNLHSKKLKGILNGIDTQFWNPESDQLLTKNYNEKEVTEGKKANKKTILEKLDLHKDLAKPLFVSITRLAMQKGPDLIYAGMQKAIEMGGQFVLLGSTEDPETKELFTSLSNHPNVAINLNYDEPLSHLLYAGGDFLLMPSIFEPCGIAQMIAMRYGTLPLVRATGGLKDTVEDEKTGLLFQVPDNRGVTHLIERAFALYPTEKFHKMVQNAMEKDYSWDQSVKKYLDIYK